MYVRVALYTARYYSPLKRKKLSGLKVSKKTHNTVWFFLLALFMCKSSFKPKFDWPWSGISTKFNDLFSSIEWEYFQTLALWVKLLTSTMICSQVWVFFILLVCNLVFLFWGGNSIVCHGLCLKWKLIAEVWGKPRSWDNGLRFLRCV